MEMLVEHVEVWAAPIPDRPGGLAELLAGLRDVGVDLQFAVSRRAAEHPGQGVVFVTPLQGDREIAAAAQLGFNVTHVVHSVRVMGQERQGVVADLTEKLARAGINLRGFSAAAIGTQFVAYIALDSRQDADRAIAVLAAG